MSKKRRMIMIILFYFGTLGSGALLFMFAHLDTFSMIVLSVIILFILSFLSYYFNQARRG